LAMLCREGLCYRVLASLGSVPEAEFQEPVSLDLPRGSAGYQGCSAFRGLAKRSRAWERLCPV